MAEPVVIAQSGEIRSTADYQAWMDKVSIDAKGKGVTFGRVTKHDEIDGLVLFEGWEIDPGPDGQGEPRFQFAAQ